MGTDGKKCGSVKKDENDETVNDYCIIRERDNGDL